MTELNLTLSNELTEVCAVTVRAVVVTIHVLLRYRVLLPLFTFVLGDSQ